MQEDTDNSACISGKTQNKKYSFFLALIHSIAIPFI